MVFVAAYHGDLISHMDAVLRDRLMHCTLKLRVLFNEIVLKTESRKANRIVASL
jgi:hypothetical protein